MQDYMIKAILLEHSEDKTIHIPCEVNDELLTIVYTLLKINKE